MTDLVTRALRFADVAHAGRVDLRGRDYWPGHLTEVAGLLRPYGAVLEAVGWLHDTLEDTKTTRNELLSAFGADVFGAVDAVTRKPGEPYALLIERAAAHPLGRLVKLADNWINLTGLDALAALGPDHARKAAALRPRYVAARTVLEGSLLR